MLNRLLFFLIALFWITMNVLLWRSEFGGRSKLGSSVPVAVVWQKMLTAPDDSSLEINRQGKRIGFCRWVANVGEELATGKMSSEDFIPEGMVKALASYSVDVEGNVAYGGPTNRVRFNWSSRFATNHAWQELTLRLALRPAVWEFRTVAAQESLRVKYEEDTVTQWERNFSFAELRDPRKLAQELGGPLAVGLLGQAGVSEQKNLSLGLNWQARNDWLKIGHAQVRVYRLQTRLLDRYQAVIIVSRVGEILRVELPNDIVLVNEALLN